MLSICSVLYANFSINQAHSPLDGTSVIDLNGGNIFDLNQFPFAYLEPDCKLMIAVTTENGSLLIYQESTLVWCAELLDQTISMQRGNFKGLAGGLVSLTITGRATVGYLGSNLSVFKVPPINLSKLDYEKSKIELEEMEKEINSSVDNSGWSTFLCTA